MQDFLNMYFNKIYKFIRLIYNFVFVMLWRYFENVVFDEVKVVYYCVVVSIFSIRFLN